MSFAHTQFIDPILRDPIWLYILFSILYEQARPVSYSKVWDNSRYAAVLILDGKVHIKPVRTLTQSRRGKFVFHSR